ncbi:MAG: proton-conducting transporter membrane subunit [Saprospiraceae bacterium]
MENFIHVFILLPLLGFVASLAIHKSQEKALARVVLYTTGTYLVCALGFNLYWLWRGATPFNLKDLSLYASSNYIFLIDFFYDRLTATYLTIGALIGYMVAHFSRYYMHRESGYKRYFNTILFFFLGYSITILAGNFETLFIGWEVLGLSSFLLIAFYRLRYLPVKNAIKVFSIYRIGDVGILLAMWMSHHLWHENVTFFKLNNYQLVHHQLEAHTGIGVFVSVMIMIAAMAKSAQAPFTAWLPRAMEGPTPSSAIFYGSLSVHIGAYLLLRTHPFWEHQTSVKWLIAVVGLTTAIVATLIASVQSTIKSKIAYSSAAQIGIIFIEIAAGWEVVALIHIAGNAFLRSYQLLVSPSAVAYMVREQFYKYEQPAPAASDHGWISRVKRAIYILSLKEWYLDSFVFRLIFNPLKRLRALLGFITLESFFFVFLPIYAFGFYLAYTRVDLSPAVKNGSSIVAGLLALLMAAKSYNERGSTRLAWLLVVFNHFFIDLAVTLSDHLDLKEATIYLSGILLSGALGYFCLHQVRAFEHHFIGLNQFHGLVAKYQVLAFLFLIACLGVAGFPITTAFLGEDLILTHIREDQYALAALIPLTFIINGISVIRIYARVFLGHNARSFQHKTDLTI